LRRFASALPFFLVPLVGISCWEPQAQPATEPPAPSAAAPPGAVYEGEAFTFQEIQPGIYHAVGTGNLSVGCNGSIFVNEDDVLIVDSHITPAAAWATLIAYALLFLLHAAIVRFLLKRRGIFNFPLMLGLGATIAGVAVLVYALNAAP